MTSNLHFDEGDYSEEIHVKMKSFIPPFSTIERKLNTIWLKIWDSRFRIQDSKRKV